MIYVTTLSHKKIFSFLSFWFFLFYFLTPSLTPSLSSSFSSSCMWKFYFFLEESVNMMVKKWKREKREIYVSSKRVANGKKRLRGKFLARKKKVNSILEMIEYEIKQVKLVWDEKHSDGWVWKVESVAFHLWGLFFAENCEFNFGWKPSTD